MGLLEASSQGSKITSILMRHPSELCHLLNSASAYTLKILPHAVMHSERTYTESSPVILHT